MHAVIANSGSLRTSATFCAVVISSLTLPNSVECRTAYSSVSWRRKYSHSAPQMVQLSPATQQARQNKCEQDDTQLFPVSPSGAAHFEQFSGSAWLLSSSSSSLMLLSTLHEKVEAGRLKAVSHVKHTARQGSLKPPACLVSSPTTGTQTGSNKQKHTPVAKYNPRTPTCCAKAAARKAQAR
jgi:hypothetical protein